MIGVRIARGRRAIRIGGLAGVVAAALWTSPPVLAITPPAVDLGAVPPSGTPGPVQATSQNGECSISGLVGGAAVVGPAPGQRQLDLPAAWQFARGDGQTVAVIDTGVRPGPRLPALEAGGDYIGSTDGLVDCDGHGTLVAGLIAGQPGDDGFAGVAPAARLLSLRAASATITPAASGGDPELTRAAFTTAALSRAIVHAADLGARVIVVSVAHCLPADRTLDQSELGAAIRYAAVDKDAVVVAAAGDNGAAGSGAGGGCQSNPLTDLGRPNDPRNWSGVTSVSIPSSWQPYVLSVASAASGGQPSKFTMAGPWVGVAAPGENIVSVSNRDDGGLANGLPGARQQLVPLNGTGYASGYVAGIAALVRSRYPELSAAQVIHRITATAHNTARAPSNVVGTGLVDPVAALTWQLPSTGSVSGGESPKRVDPPPQPAPKDYTPQLVAFGGTAALGLAVGAAAIAGRRRKESTL